MGLVATIATGDLDFFSCKIKVTNGHQERTQSRRTEASGFGMNSMLHYSLSEAFGQATLCL